MSKSGLLIVLIAASVTVAISTYSFCSDDACAGKHSFSEEANDEASALQVSALQVSTEYSRSPPHADIDVPTNGFGAEAVGQDSITEQLIQSFRINAEIERVESELIRMQAENFQLQLDQARASSIVEDSRARAIQLSQEANQLRTQDLTISAGGLTGHGHAALQVQVPEQQEAQDAVETLAFKGSTDEVSKEGPRASGLLLQRDTATRGSTASKDVSSTIGTDALEDGKEKSGATSFWDDLDWSTYGISSNSGRVAVQLIFGIFYYFLVVQYYPRLNLDQRPADMRQFPRRAVELQKRNPVTATLQASPRICIMSFCCPGARAAHTFDITGVLNYWLGLVLVSCFPCCTLFLTSSCSDLNERLGGETMGICEGLCAACLCSCCLIAQDAESLDIVTGVRV